LATQTNEDTKKNQQQELVYAITDIYKLLSKMMLKSAAKENLTIQQASVLRILAKKGPIQMNLLCQELSVTPPNITSLIDRLEKKGLVKRTEDKKDRRKTEIQLTTNGKELYETVTESYKGYIQESFSALTPEEQDRLSQILGKLKAETSRKEIIKNHRTDNNSN
jgi:MarR family transcriptional regulator, 2-MHQ and catechol-resistance regulon repressor